VFNRVGVECPTLRWGQVDFDRISTLNGGFSVYYGYGYTLTEIYHDTTHGNTKDTIAPAGRKIADSAVNV
jgi:hypothetical protein